MNQANQIEEEEESLAKLVKDRTDWLLLPVLYIYMYIYIKKYLYIYIHRFGIPAQELELEVNMYADPNQQVPHLQYWMWQRSL